MKSMLERMLRLNQIEPLRADSMVVKKRLTQIQRSVSDDDSCLTTKGCELLEDTAYGANNPAYRLNSGTSAISTIDWQSCEAHCDATYAATFFAWSKTDGKCWCRSGYDGVNPNPNFTSGRVGCHNTTATGNY